jgi:DNA-binding CsgD family transcriptional regulator
MGRTKSAMKQRPLTDIQLTVLTLKQLGNTNYAISQVLGCHPDTVSNKWTAIKRGIAKGAYNNVPGNLNTTQDLF